MTYGPAARRVLVGVLVSSAAMRDEAGGMNTVTKNAPGTDTQGVA